ncbi:MAG: GNAT family N-acetyltransferase [Hyphomicrobium sp.]
MIDGQPIAVRHLPSITGLPREDWDRLFPDRAEGWDYFNACEQAAPEGFQASAMAAYAGDALVAAVPLFRTDYRLDLSLEGPLKPAVEWSHRNAPKRVAVPVLGMGSPLTEECPIGFQPGLKDNDRIAAFAALLRGMNDHAADYKIPLLALKDVMDRDATWANELLQKQGFTGVATLPLATLHLHFKDEDEYLASLSSSMRSDLRKKMRRASKVKFEFRDSIADIKDEIAALFEETRANSKVDYGSFDEVPATYFREVMRSCDGKAQVMLASIDDELVSFNISLAEPNRLLEKDIGMRYPAAREHNLYFVNWMVMARHCIERGIPWMQMGQTSYRQKARLGCQLKRSWIYFKHRNPLINPLFKLFGPMMAFDKMDPDLQALGQDARYLEPGAAP